MRAILVFEASGRDHELGFIITSSFLTVADAWILHPGIFLLLAGCLCNPQRSFLFDHPIYRPVSLPVGVGCFLALF